MPWDSKNIFYIRKNINMLLLFVFVFVLMIFFVNNLKMDSNNLNIIKESLTPRDQDIARLWVQIARLRKKLISAGIPDNVSNWVEKGWPIIYAITPTYARPEQKAELIRQCHTFLFIPNMHWIVIEDSEEKTLLVTRFLENCGVTYTHLNSKSNTKDKIKDGQPSWTRHRGINQRNLGIDFLRKHYAGVNPKNVNGVVYFADDDNTYSTELFHLMNDIRKVAVWPVGLVGGSLVEKPIVKNGIVTGWDVRWTGSRKYAIDMAGFAVNLSLLLKRKNVQFSHKAKLGHLESSFLSGLIGGLHDLEPKSPTKILVWHTKSQKPNLKLEGKIPSDIGMEI